MAAADRFRAVITGRGGHAAMPHLTADSVVTGAQIITALQPLVSRETSPTDSTVVTISRFNTGAQSLTVHAAHAHDYPRPLPPAVLPACNMPNAVC